MRTFKVHSQAIVETKKIGEGTTIWAYVHILQGAIIGKNCNICDHCFIENKVIIGDNVTIKCGVYLWDGITIENSVFIGPAVTFSNDLYPRSKNSNYSQQKTLLQVGSSIGSNSTILPGVTIGKYALVGAGSVVTKNVENFTIIYGNPAKKQGYICVCGKKLKFTHFKANCNCGTKFELVNKIPKLTSG